MVEMSCVDSTPDAHTFHVVHPRGVPFNSLISSAASSLNVPLVPFSEWLSKLSEEHKAQSNSDANLEKAQASNPALRLFSFYQSVRTGPEWEPLGVARLDTARAVRVSKVLAEGAKPLGEENVRKWMSAWRSSGFLPPDRKKTIARRSIQLSTLEAATAGLATSLPVGLLNGPLLLKGAVAVYMASKFGFLMVFFGSLQLLYAYF
jgi:hypothetical protein